ncbi:MAG: NUDIX domain-containing protein [Streptosporangiaceae bacterium]|jgi:8-oxo-dGTP diphosphatase
MPDRTRSGKARAGGAVVWKPGPDGPVLALIHRPKYGDWTLPKGKCEPGEHVLLAAVREVAEETGLRVTLGRPLGRSRYPVEGRMKRVDYWAATSERPADPFAPNPEVDDLSWLPADPAAQTLTYKRDRTILERFTAGPALTTPCILLRHASAGSKHRWQGNDLDRPLDAAGAADADSLARLLACYGQCRVISSAAERCVATVRPYAELAGAKIELEPLFTVRQRGGDQDGRAARERMTAIVRAGGPVVICAHRENLPLLLATACGQLGADPPGDLHLRKSDFLVLHQAGRRLAAIERHHPRPA